MSESMLQDLHAAGGERGHRRRAASSIGIPAILLLAALAASPSNAGVETVLSDQRPIAGFELFGAGI